VAHAYQLSLLNWMLCLDDKVNELVAGPPSGFLRKYETPNADFERNPLRCDSTDAKASWCTSATLTRWSNSAMRVDCCNSKGALQMNVLGAYSVVIAPTKLHLTKPFSSYISKVDALVCLKHYFFRAQLDCFFYI
jgi:hypothetical protein